MEDKDCAILCIGPYLNSPKTGDMFQLVNKLVTLFKIFAFSHRRRPFLKVYRDKFILNLTYYSLLEPSLHIQLLIPGTLMNKEKGRNLSKDDHST
jgi:hypothetical protein